MTGVVSARNDSCSSRLRLERPVLSSVLQGRQSPISLAAASPCASTSRIGGKGGIGGEQGRLALLTASRTVRWTAAAPPTPQSTRTCPQNWWEVKLKISRLRLEMTGVHLAFGSKGQASLRLFKADNRGPQKILRFSWVGHPPPQGRRPPPQ